MAVNAMMPAFMEGDYCALAMRALEVATTAYEAAAMLGKPLHEFEGFTTTPFRGAWRLHAAGDPEMEIFDPVVSPDAECHYPPPLPLGPMEGDRPATEQDAIEHAMRRLALDGDDLDDDLGDIPVSPPAPPPAPAPPRAASPAGDEPSIVEDAGAPSMGDFLVRRASKPASDKTPYEIVLVAEEDGRPHYETLASNLTRGEALKVAGDHASKHKANAFVMQADSPRAFSKHRPAPEPAPVESSAPETKDQGVA